MKSIKTVIFDFGRVISLDHDTAVAKQMSDILSVLIESFLPAYFAFRTDYDQGIITVNEYWNRVAEMLKADLPTKETIDQLVKIDMLSWSNYNQATLQYIESLYKKGVRLFLLSNMPLEMIAHLRKTVQWLNYFSEIIISAEEKMVKPNKDIFMLTIDRTNEKADDLLFIDDSAENCESAAKIGINTINFVSTESMIREIESKYVLLRQ